MEIQMLETEHGIFTSNEVTGETAEEVYAKYLANKDKQTDTCPTETDAEKIARLEHTVQELSDMLIMMSQQ